MKEDIEKLKEENTILNFRIHNLADDKIKLTEEVAFLNLQNRILSANTPEVLHDLSKFLCGYKPRRDWVEANYPHLVEIFFGA